MLALLVLTSTTATRASERVVVVAPEAPVSSDRVVHQVAGELRAAGFDVTVRRRAEEPDDRELEAVAKDTGSFAAIALWLPQNRLEAEVWVVDLVTGKTSLRRLEGGRRGGQEPAIFALRAVELLQASLLELDTGRPPEGDVAPSPEVKRFVRSATAAPREVPALPARPTVSWSLLAGASIGKAPGGMPATLAPSLGLGWRPLPAWSGQLWASGPSLASLEGAEGSATLDQELVVLRLTHTWSDPDAPVAGFVVGGAGAYRLGARGAAEAAYESTAVDVWAAAALFGPGLTLRLSQGLHLFAELDAVWLMPRPEVRFAGRRVADGGRPWVVGSLGADVRW